MRTQHKWGVEIETILQQDQARIIADRCTARGVPMSVQEYNHRRTPQWKVVRDGSCGMEFVSPPINDLDQLKIVCDVLNEYENEQDTPLVSRATGLHVHHDARDFTVAQIITAMSNYDKIEPELQKVLAPSRRRNQYCEPIHGMTVRHPTTNTLVPWRTAVEALGTTDCTRFVNMIMPNRYHSFNLQAWTRHGTLEFRAHGGTVSYEKISNWVLFTSGLMERARAGEQIANEMAANVTKLVRWAVAGLRVETQAVRAVRRVRNDMPREGTIAHFIITRMLAGVPDAEILAQLRTAHPEARTNRHTIQPYHARVSEIQLAQVRRPDVPAPATPPPAASSVETESLCNTLVAYFLARAQRFGFYREGLPDTPAEAVAVGLTRAIPPGAPPEAALGARP